MDKRVYVVLPVIAGACWGITGIFTRYFDQAGLDNITIVFTRTSVGMILSLICIAFKGLGQLKMAKKDFLIVIFSSLMGTTVFMICYNQAVIRINLALAAVILCMTPVFVMALSAVIFGEKITKTKVVCMAMAILGCAMISGVFEANLLAQLDLFGVIMASCAMASSGIYILATKSISSKGYSSFVLCFYAFAFSNVVISPFVDWSSYGAFVAEAPVQSVGMMLLQSIITSMTPSICYIVGLKYVTAGKTAILEGGAEPVAALAAGVILYNEIPSVIGVIGIVITIAALGWLSRSDAKE